MRHVAALAGVGVKTVSRVVNGEPGVRPETEQRVLQAIERLDYQADMVARNLRRSDRRSQTIGVLVHSVANPFSGQVLRAVEEAAAARGVSILASSVEDSSDRERQLLDIMRSRRVDGLIVSPTSHWQNHAQRKIGPMPPVVLVDRIPPNYVGDAVVSDNAAGARAAAIHLLNHGHRRFVFVGRDPEVSTAEARQRAFRETLNAHGVPAEQVLWFDRVDDEDSARRAVLRAVDSPLQPTAVFAAQNLLTLGAVRALRDRGFQRNVALIGFDDFPLADLLDPGVTVVRQEPASIGRMAAATIFRRIDGDASPAQVQTVPIELVVRGSGEIRPQGSD